MAALTEAEELELELEQARARKAQAETDATAQSNAAAGVINADTGAVEDPNELVGAGKSLVRGVGRGFAKLPDAPAAIYTGVKNLPTRAYNTFGGERPVDSSGERGDAPPTTDLLAPQRQRDAGAAPIPVQPLQKPTSQLSLDTAPETPIGKAYDASFPVDENHPYADMFGSVAGPAAIEAVASGGVSLASLPAIVKSLPRAVARTTATTGGALVGSAGGGALDRALGGSGDLGSVFGGTIGGGVGSNLLMQGGWKGLNKTLTNKESVSKYIRAKQAGVEPDLPLVGNEFARRTADATTSQLFGGGPVLKARANQHEQMDAAAQQIAADIRGEPSSGTIDKTTIGQRVRDTGAVADKNAVVRQNEIMDPIYEQGGRELPIDQVKQRADMEALRLQQQPHKRSAFDTEINNMDVSRLDPENAPKVVDVGLEAQLEMKLNQAQRKLQGANNADRRASAQAEIDSILNQQQANRGQTLDEAKETRSDTGRRIEGQVPLTARQTIALKKIQTEAMKNATTRAGVPPEEFDAANRDYKLIAGQRRKLIQPITEAKTQGQGEAYNKMFTGTARANADRVNSLQLFAPDELRQTLADELELRLRGPAGAGGPARPDLIGPSVKSAPDWFEKSPDATKSILAGGGDWDNNRLNALLQTMRTDAERSGRTAPSGGNSRGPLGSTFGNAVNAVIGAGSFMTGGAAALPLTTVLPALAYGTGKFLTSPRITKRVVNPGPWINDKHALSRILASAVTRVNGAPYANNDDDELEQGAR